MMWPSTVVICNGLSFLNLLYLMVMVVPVCYKCVWGVFIIKMSSCKRSKCRWCENSTASGCAVIVVCARCLPVPSCSNPKFLQSDLWMDSDWQCWATMIVCARWFWRISSGPGSIVGFLHWARTYHSWALSLSGNKVIIDNHWCNGYWWWCDQAQ